MNVVIAFLAILVVLVFVHELGHFLVAKRAGITVEEFGIGFPPRLASFTWRGTRYSLNAIPLGGFVRMLGEDGEVELRRLRERGLTGPEIERAMEGAFNRRPVWVRVAVLVAGVVMNFILAAILIAVAAVQPQLVGQGPVRVKAIPEADSPAASVLRVGDVIHSVDGRSFELSSDLTAYIAEQAGTEVTLQIERAGERTEVSVVPRTVEERGPGEGPLGFEYDPTSLAERPPLVSNPVDALSTGVSVTTQVAVAIPGGLADAIGGLLGLNPNADDARGPIGIAQETGRVLDAALAEQLYFVALLSINLAVLNVLPFPPLDGGRVAVVLLESVRRRKLPAEREALIYLAGFAVLLALVILVSINDVERWLSGG